jgi:S-DNA-T family DNA segregation ATPase FtsK/SpoIIIE
VLAAGLTGQRKGPRLVLVSPKPSPLRSAVRWATVVEGARDAVAIAEALATLRPGSSSPETIVFVDDLTELGEEFDAALAEVVGTRHLPVHIVAAAETRKAKVSYAGSALGELRQGQRGLLLQPNLPDEEDLFEVRMAASSTLGFPPGRGFLVEGDRATLVQVLSS